MEIKKLLVDSNMKLPQKHYSIELNEVSSAENFYNQILCFCASVVKNISNKKLPKHFRQLALVLFISSSLTQCGGGGGGGSSSSSSSDNSGVRFLHAAIEASPRQLNLNGSAVSEYISFGKASGFKSGTGLSNAALISRTGEIEALPAFDLSNNARVDVVLFQGSQGPRALTFAHMSAPSGRAVRVIHALRSESGGVAVVSYADSSVSFGNASPYQTVADAVSLNINGSPQIIALPTEGRLFTVVVLGEVGYLSRNIILIDE